MKKLENLLNFEDFKTNWKAEEAKKTKRTETGLDILKESAYFEVDPGFMKELEQFGVSNVDTGKNMMSVVIDGIGSVSIYPDTYEITHKHPDYESGFGAGPNKYSEDMKNKLSRVVYMVQDYLKNNPVNENVEEIIPAGEMAPKFGIDSSEKIEKIKSFIQYADDDAIEEMVNNMREILLEMEQQGFVDSDTTDQIDDKYDGDWISWIEEVIDLPDFPEEGLNNLVEIIENVRGSYPEDVECPDCEGTGQDEEGEDCERCDGTGRVYRPDDIPPDDYEDEDEENEFDFDEDDEDEDDEDEEETFEFDEDEEDED